MKAYELRDVSGIEALKLVELAEAKAGHGQVKIRVRAASLNYRDLVVARGGYGGAVKLPLIPLSDGAGEVAEVGEGVTRFKVGDRVAATFFQTWIAGELTDAQAKAALGGGVDGMLTESLVLDEGGIVHFPDHLSFEEAATLPCAAVTAWASLVSYGNLRAGQSVLVLGAGGVSIFALQFAKMSGARVIATSSSDEKLARLKKMGADGLINYKTTPNWDERVRELTSGAGVDHVVEVGGAGTFPRSLRAVRRGGTISLIGVLSGQGQIDPLPILMKGVRVQGVNVGSREMFEAMNQAISAHKLRPVVDRVFPFEQAREAYRYLESGAHFGKVVVKL